MFQYSVMKFINIILLFLLVMNLSCARRIDKAMRNAKYSAYELVGVEKRDLFRKEVGNVREEQEESGAAFKDALTRLKEVYHLKDGEIDKSYRKLNSSYQKAQSESEELKKRILTLEKVASDLFEEWEKEIGEISTQDLKEKSKTQLKKTKQKYQSLAAQLDVAK
jgi:flagellar motility protein MotE (MotC chaperone)